jgi:hypothetical protein
LRFKKALIVELVYHALLPRALMTNEAYLVILPIEFCECLRIEAQ